MSACSSWEKPGGPDLPWCRPALPHTRLPWRPLPLPDLGCPVRAGRGHNPCCSLLGALAMVEAKTGLGWGRRQGAWSTSPVPGPRPRMGCQLGAPAGLWALHEEDGEVTTPHRGKLEARRGSATCPGPQGGPTHSWAPVCPLGGGSRPLPAPHLSTKNAVCPGGRLLRVQTADVGHRDAVDSRHRVPASSGSAPATEPRSTGLVQGGSAHVSAHLHAPLSTLPCRPPTPAATPSRQMCRGGAGAIPGDTACQPRGPWAQRAPAPQPHGSRRLSSRLAAVQHTSLPTQGGSWLSRDLALRVACASVHVQTCT